MTYSFIRYIIISSFLFLTALPSSAQETEDFNSWMNLDSDELIKKGENFKKNKTMDSALMAYSIVCNRTKNLDDKEEVRKCCKAYIEKIRIHFTYFFDYSKAYEDIIAAMKLKDDAGIEYYKLDNAASIFHHVVAVMCRDWNMERSAMDFCRDAFDAALKEGDKENLHVFVTNMIIMSCNLNESEKVDDLWKSYSDNVKHDTFTYRFNELFYEYLRCRIKKNYAGAVSASKKMLDISEDSLDRRRIVIAHNSIVEASENAGDYEKALFYLEKQEKLVQKWMMRENSIELLDIKQRLYRKLGNNKLADECSRNYFLKKDSLLNHKELSSIYRAQYNDKSRNMEKKIEEMHIRKTIYDRVFLVFITLMIILFVMVVMLFIKIKQLKKCNITIYENNEESFKKEEKDREKLKNEVLKLEKETEEPTETAEEDVRADDEEKYKNNSISDEEKKKLLDKILTVMENVDEICSDTFSGARLAELTGYKYNYVSLVINENYGCNFNSFLNRFRIKEACRRLADDENYGNYTIDTISSSLGFKSRTTLTMSFKKIVGLTPSQYRSIAKEKNLVKMQ